MCIGDTIVLTLDKQYDVNFYDAYDRWLGNEDELRVRLSQTINNYYVKLVDTNGCESRKNISIEAIHCCDIQVPNAFSPNGDGLNDKFGIVSQGEPQDFVMHVYNRMDNLVFVSYHSKYKWDDMNNG